MFSWPKEFQIKVAVPESSTFNIQLFLHYCYTPVCDCSYKNCNLSLFEQMGVLHAVFGQNWKPLQRLRDTLIFAKDQIWALLYYTQFAQIRQKSLL